MQTCAGDCKAFAGLTGTYALARSEKEAQSGPRAALLSLLLRCGAHLERFEASRKRLVGQLLLKAGCPRADPMVNGVR